MQQKVVMIDPDLHQKFKVECVKQRVDMKDVINDLVEQWLTGLSKSDAPLLTKDCTQNKYAT